jgi:hypothetical protein
MAFQYTFGLKAVNLNLFVVFIADARVFDIDEFAVSDSRAVSGSPMV